MKLSSSYGMNIVLAKDYKTATKKEGKYNHATVCSKESLNPGQPFQVILLSCYSLVFVCIVPACVYLILLYYAPYYSLRLVMAVIMTGVCSLDSRLCPLTEPPDTSTPANTYKGRALSCLQTLPILLGSLLEEK